MPRRNRWQEVWRRKGMSRAGQEQGTEQRPAAFDIVVTNGGTDDVVTDGNTKVSTNN